MSILHKAVYFTQFVLILIIIVIIFQMFFMGSYAAILLKSVVWINYCLASVIFAIFGIRLLLWENLNRNHVLIMYSVAGLFLAVTCIVSILYVNNQLSGTRGIELIYPIKNSQAITMGANNPFSTTFMISSAMAFVLTWSTTVFFTSSLYESLGKDKVFNYSGYTIALFSFPISTLHSRSIQQLQTKWPNLIWYIAYYIF